MIEHHLFYEDGDGDTLLLEPADATGKTLLLNVPSGRVNIGHEEAAHLILNLAAFLATYDICDDESHDA